MHIIVFSLSSFLFQLFLCIFWHHLHIKTYNVGVLLSHCSLVVLRGPPKAFAQSLWKKTLATFRQSVFAAMKHISEHSLWIKVSLGKNPSELDPESSGWSFVWGVVVVERDSFLLSWNKIWKWNVPYLPQTTAGEHVVCLTKKIAPIATNTLRNAIFTPHI